MDTDQTIQDETIYAMLGFIAARCDGAVTLDEVGFDGVDTKFGRRAAALPFDVWDEGILREALCLLPKYVRQLSSRWSEDDLNALRARAKEARRDKTARQRARQLLVEQEERKNVTINPTETGGAAVTLPKGLHTAREALKSGVEGRQFSWETKQWMVPLHSLPALLTWAQEQGFSVPEWLPEAAEQAEGATPPNPRHIAVQGDSATLTFPYDAEVVAAVRSLPGRRWNAAAKQWTAEASPALAAFAEAHGFDVTGDPIPEAKEVAEPEAALVDLSAATEPTGAVDVALAEHLYPFQQAGVEYAVTKRRAIIGDEMGLGKTRQGISFAATLLRDREARPGQVVIVCPSSLKANWRREVADLWTTDVEQVGTRKPWAVEGRVVIVNYDVLKQWGPTLDPEVLIVDESHYAKERKSQRTQAVLAMAKRVPAEGGVLLLTGTVITNRPKELVTQLEAVDGLPAVAPPPRRGTSTKDYMFSFLFRYCFSEWRDVPGRAKPVPVFDGANHRQELNAKMRGACYVRREKAQVLHDLPPKAVPNTVWMSLNGALKEYRKAEGNLLAYLAEEGGAEAVTAAKNAEHLVMVATLRRLLAEAKEEAVVEWILDFLDQNPTKKVLVFAVHKTMQHALRDRLAEAGQDVTTILASQRDVEEQKERFTKGSSRVMVASLAAAREGHTLHAEGACTDVVFVEQGWVPGHHMQAEDRLHRIGQTGEVQPWYLLADDTFDEDMKTMLDDKRRVVTAVTTGVDLDVEDEGSSILDTLKNLIDRTSRQ